jgi:serine/threonine protein kinase
MAVTLTGYHGGVNPQTQISGLQTLKGAGEQKAQDILLTLRGDLHSKSGVVRLMHTSKANKEMKFQNAGAFKNLFLKGDKMQRSGEVLTDLLKSAGLPPAKVREFQAYVAARGKAGVESQKLLQYIDTLHAETGDSPEEVLGRFGVQWQAPGKELGKGAYGQVNLMRYRGEDYVYKQPWGQTLNLGTLHLTGADGQVLKPKTGQLDPGRQSFAHYNPDDDRASDSPVKPQVKAGGPRENSLWAPSESVPGSMEYGQMLPPDGSQIEGLDPYDQLGDHPSIRFSGEVHGKPEIAQQEPSSQLKQAPQNAQPLIQEEVQPQPLGGIPEGGSPNLPKTETDARPKLARAGLGAAARLKAQPQVVTPALYVVQEEKSHGAYVYHAVGGHQLKKWAQIQTGTSAFTVVGLLMPKAKGSSPIEYPKLPLTQPGSPPPTKPAGPPVVQVDRADLPDMARSALNYLRDAAKEGIIHGDIKPENMIWDSKSKTLQLVDSDNLQKISKKPGTNTEAIIKQKGEVGAVATMAYNNPWGLVSAGGTVARPGLGRDLFSMGLSMLEITMRAEGRHEEFDQLQVALTRIDQEAHKIVKLMNRPGVRDAAMNAIESKTFAPGSAAHFAQQCIIKGMQVEQRRVAEKDFGFPRYSEGSDNETTRVLDELAGLLPQ